MSATTGQPAFATALLAPSQPVPSGIRGTNAAQVARRFAVHRNNVVASLVDALSESFPVCRALVGEAFFRAMARERVLADPPRTPVLFEYVEGFADFMAGFAPAGSVPYLADVARIETLRVRAWHAADARPVRQSAWQRLAAAPECLAATRIRLHPACHWVRCRHAAHGIWAAHQGLENPSDASLEGIDTTRPEDVLVVRPRLQVRVELLPRGAVMFLDALGQGECLGSAFDAVDRAHPGIEVGELFAILVRNGVAVAFDSPPEH